MEKLKNKKCNEILKWAAFTWIAIGVILQILCVATGLFYIFKIAYTSTDDTGLNIFGWIVAICGALLFASIGSVVCWCFILFVCKGVAQCCGAICRFKKRIRRKNFWFELVSDETVNDIELGGVSADETTLYEEG